jgi:hypothetical protein
LAEELGYKIPNFHGVTTMGIVKGKLKVEQMRLAALDASARMSLKATESARSGLLELMMTVGIAGGPLAFLAGAKKKRPGDFTKEEYEAAGKMSPEDFDS